MKQMCSVASLVSLSTKYGAGHFFFSLVQGRLTGTTNTSVPQHNEDLCTRVGFIPVQRGFYFMQSLKTLFLVHPVGLLLHRLSESLTTTHSWQGDQQ